MTISAKTDGCLTANAYERKVYRNEGNPALLDLMPSGAKRILDVGCGAGSNARILKERGHLVWGITLSEEELRLSKPWCESIWLANVETDQFSLPTEHFDALLLSHVLEHLINPRETLVRLSRYIRKGGSILVAVPNMAHWRMRWRLLLGNWKRDENGFMDRTHLQFWSYLTAPELFRDVPYVLRQRYPGDPAVPLWPLRRVLPRLCKRIDYHLGRLLPNLFSMQVLLVAEKVQNGK